ncbi:MAG: hypothetical protein FJZ15_03295, partial [Candidatus Omnitrophica bacterium]|nr:hypothetical protein [Candidatus Omnitrophota bacterium]
MPESKKYHFNKKDIFSVGLVFLAALILRLIYFAQYSSVSFFPFLSYSDSEAYYSWARDILSGDVIGKAAFMKWPLYAYFLAGLFFIFGINALAVFSLQFVLGSINCVLVYLIGRLMFNRAVGLIAGLLCAFYGLFIFYDALLTYTTLSIFLNLILFLLFFLVRGRPAKGNFFWLGLYSGICAITQGSVLIFSIAAAFLILVFNKTGLKKFCLSFGFFIIGLGIIIGGVTLRNYFVEKDFVLLA